MNSLPPLAHDGNTIARGGVMRPGGTEAAVSEIRLLTLNLGLPCLAVADRWRIAFAEHHAERLAAAPDLLASADADVIALQEVHSPADRTALASAMAARYPFCAQAPGSRSLLGSGLMLLSRFPIARSAFVPCHGGPWWLGPLWRQGFLLTEIELPSAGRVSLVNVHLAASLPFGKLDAPASEQNRKREVEQLLALAGAGAGATILLGDFNSDVLIHPEGYRRILAAGYLDGFVVANGAAPPGAVTWDAANPANARGRFRDSPSQRIDHVFIRAADRQALEPVAARILFDDKAVRTKGTERVCLSDHYGMMVTLAVSATPGRRR